MVRKYHPTKAFRITLKMLFNMKLMNRWMFSNNSGAENDLNYISNTYTVTISTDDTIININGNEDY